MTLYEILCRAETINMAIHADYPNAADDPEARQDSDRRWDAWHDLIEQAQAFVPEESRDLLCEFDLGMSRADLEQMLIDDGAIEFYPT